MKHDVHQIPVPTPVGVDYQRLIDAATDHAITMLDPSGRILSWNRGAERMTGYAAEEVIGESCAMFYCADARTRGEDRHEMDIALEQGRLELDATIRLDALLPAEAKLVAGVTAVIEDAQGVLSYWALRHAAGEPDFHRAQDFILEIDAVRN